MISLIKTLLLAILIISCNKNIKDKHLVQEVDITESNMDIKKDTTPRVTGIGGIFILSDDPKETAIWYGENLGLKIDNYGSPFEFRNANRPEEINYLRWSLFEKNTNYLDPSKKEFMINYRVHNMEGLVRKLKNNGVLILDSITSYEYGKFVHLLDPEGNKIELWEPVDSFLTKLGRATTK